MNKSLLLKQIQQELEALLQVAKEAAHQAYTTATHEENVAENKYDTLGLEAAYLAQGQSRRVAECEADVAAYKGVAVTMFSPQTPIAIGALIELKDEFGDEKLLYLGPAAGGLTFAFKQQTITIITPSAPLGAALMGLFVADELTIKVATKEIHYEVIAVS